MTQKIKKKDTDDDDDDKNEEDDDGKDGEDEIENDGVGHDTKPLPSLSGLSPLNKQDGQRHIQINNEEEEKEEEDVDPVGDHRGRGDKNNNNNNNTLTNLNSHIDDIGLGTRTGTTTMKRRGSTNPILPLRLHRGFDLRRHLSVDALWTRYRSLARQYYIQLDIADDVISRILFWLPHRNHQEQPPSTTLLSSSRTAEEDEQGTAMANIIDSASSSSPYWREVMYGLLSLHRLMLSLALQHEPQSSTGDSESRVSSGGYGMTVQTRDEPCVPAVKVRILLTVIQSILPSILAVAEATVGRQQRREQSSNGEQGGDKNSDHSSLHLPSSSLSSHRMLNRRVLRTTRVKLYIEQIRFLLRTYLLCNYWKQQQQQQRRSRVGGDTSPSSSLSSSSSAQFLGILMDGGIYFATDQEGSEIEHQQKQHGMSWEKADAIARREAYVGQRTGWRRYQNSNADDDDDKFNSCQNLSPRSNVLSRIWRASSLFLNISESSKIKIAEILHVARPVIWAWFESKYALATLNCDDEAGLVVSSQSSSNTGNRMRSSSTSKLFNSVRRDRRGLLRAWVLCLGMDVLSIRMLRKTPTSSTTETRKGTNSRISRSRRTATTTTTTTRKKMENQNEDYMYEIHRRKMALFLYLLRCPVWNTVTSPILLDDGGLATLVFRRIPVVGRLLETALYDWVMYYKWLALEEG